MFYTNRDLSFAYLMLYCESLNLRQRACSSTAEQVPFKHLVGGSNPSRLTRKTSSRYNCWFLIPTTDYFHIKYFKSPLNSCSAFWLTDPLQRVSIQRTLYYRSSHR